ncbi:MAG: DUF892 family protein [Paracoccus sp. (in: a-proteobacteria)]|nr:DUF892 family protein [Paracoccus sp. (in: a-proteobacteria)]
MTIKNLEDLYLDQIKDIHSALKQSRPVVEDMAKAAKSSDLRKALENSAEGIDRGMKTLADIAQAHNTSPGGEHCKGMEGLAGEARKHGLETKFADDDAQDAAIITQYQRMAHYAIAGYGCVRTFARKLGHQDQSDQLQTELDSVWDGDRHMTELAEGGINRAAMDGK